MDCFVFYKCFLFILLIDDFSMFIDFSLLENEMLYNKLYEDIFIEG